MTLKVQRQIVDCRSTGEGVCDTPLQPIAVCPWFALRRLSQVWPSSNHVV